MVNFRRASSSRFVSTVGDAVDVTVEAMGLSEVGGRDVVVAPVGEVLEKVPRNEVNVAGVPVRWLVLLGTKTVAVVVVESSKI